MSERDTYIRSESADRTDADGGQGEGRGGGEGRAGAEGRGADDRRSDVNPVDSPVPQSPEPERDAVREGEEKLRRA